MFDVLPTLLIAVLIFIAITMLFILYLMHKRPNNFAASQVESGLMKQKTTDQLNLFDDNYGVLNVRKVDPEDHERAMTKKMNENMENEPPKKETFTPIQKQQMTETQKLEESFREAFQKELQNRENATQQRVSINLDEEVDVSIIDKRLTEQSSVEKEPLLPQDATIQKTVEQRVDVQENLTANSDKHESLVPTPPVFTEKQEPTINVSHSSHLLEDSDSDYEETRVITKSEKPAFLDKLQALWNQFIPKKSPLIVNEASSDPKQALKENTRSEIPLPRPKAVTTIAFILVAPEEQPYLGQEIIEIATQLDLSLSEEGFLEHITTTYYGDEPVYSIAHLLQPGSFDIDNVMQKEFPGLLFFMHLPSPDPDSSALDIMLKAAAYFGQSLGGVLLNDQREPLDKDMLDQLREKVTRIEKKAWEDAARALS